MRRIAWIAAATLAGVAGAGAAAVAFRDAVYWERPLPGVAVREVALDRQLEVRIGDERYAVDPRTVLRVDEAATHAALVNSGHDSFLRRVRQLVHFLDRSEGRRRANARAHRAAHHEGPDAGAGAHTHRRA